MGFLQYCSRLRDREFRRINEQNDNDQTPLDLSQSEEMTDLILDFWGKTGLEVAKELKAMEAHTIMQWMMYLKSKLPTLPVIKCLML